MRGEAAACPAPSPRHWGLLLAVGEKIRASWEGRGHAASLGLLPRSPLPSLTGHHSWGGVPPRHARGVLSPHLGPVLCPPPSAEGPTDTGAEGLGWQDFGSTHNGTKLSLAAGARAPQGRRGPGTDGQAAGTGSRGRSSDCPRRGEGAAWGPQPLGLGRGPGASGGASDPREESGLRQHARVTCCSNRGDCGQSRPHGQGRTRCCQEATLQRGVGRRGGSLLMFCGLSRCDYSSPVTEKKTQKKQKKKKYSGPSGACL